MPFETPPLRDPFYTQFAAQYDEHTTGVPGDVEFYRDLALQARGPVVELGVGTGRTAIPIARAGVPVLGLDLSREMLAIARRRAGDAGVRGIGLALGDMRRFALARPAALVTIPHRAFLHNLTTDDQLSTLACCRAALRPQAAGRRGGLLALNVFNPDLALIAHWMGRGPDDWEQSRGVTQRHDYDPAEQQADSTLRLVDEEGRRRSVHIRLRYVHRFEMEHLLTRAGFTVEALYGGFDRAPFGTASTEMVWFARAS